MTHATTGMLIKHLPTAILLLAGLAGTAHADEDEPWYTVEVVVFENRAVGAGDTEHWPDDPGAPDFTHAVTLAPAPATLPDLPPATDETSTDPASTALAQSQAQPLPFQALDGDQMTLTRVVERMASSQDYRPLLHIAWRQPATKSGTSEPVRISTAPPAAEGKAGESAPPPPPETLAETEPAAATSSETMATDGSQADAPATEGEAAATGAQVTLEGTIDLSRNRYLHLDVDLVYRPPVAPQSGGLFSIFKGDQPQVTAYRMHQSRRVRSKQIHYFDHPRFGVLTVVTPVDITTPEPEDETDQPTAQ